MEVTTLNLEQLLLSPQVLNKLRNASGENMKELSEYRFASAQNKTHNVLSNPESQTAQVNTHFCRGSFTTPLWEYSHYLFP